MTTWQSDIYGESEPLAGDLAGGAYISALRITLLSIVSLGFYWLYWITARGSSTVTTPSRLRLKPAPATTRCGTG